MSSCFSVDVGFSFIGGFFAVCNYTSTKRQGKGRVHLPVIVGSGSYQNSTMHTGQGNVNYVSYFVRRIHLEADYSYRVGYENRTNDPFPDYAVLFKVPYREPVVEDMFNNIKDFILYKEPEHVLGYDMCSSVFTDNLGRSLHPRCHFDIDVKKPFIVGPNDYVGVFYFISSPREIHNNVLQVHGTAKVWFDPV